MTGFENKKNLKKINKDAKNDTINAQIISKALLLHSKGNILEAERYYRYCIEQKINDYRIFSNYGLILKNQGKLREAELLLKKTIQLNPNWSEGHNNMGTIQKDLGKIQEAEFSYRKAIALKPDFALPHYNLGNILNNLGKIQEAEFSYRKAIALKPDFSDTYFKLFHLYEKTNNLEKLQESLKQFNNVSSIENEILLFRARLSFRNKKIKNAQEIINCISPVWLKKSNAIQEIIYWNYKAFIEDKIGNYDVAFSCFEKSQENPLTRKFNKNLYLNIINSYKENIINKKIIFYKLDDYFKDSNLCFLIGFPRSGTTLLDTILRSHKDIEVIEEKPLLSIIENLIEKKFNTRLDDIYSISKNDLKILRKHYFELMKEYTDTKDKLIIDKMPLHTSRLPLIKLLFPNAKIIFTHRHPYDTVLSCFQQTFIPNQAMANLVSLKSSSIMYDQVMKAWDIYKQNLSLNFTTSKYENLINDFDTHIQKILEFLGLEYDKNVKNYRKTALKRAKINTPSSSQVVQPLYKSSIEKWKNYEKYFKDCHQYLEKWVAYFDYL